MPDLMPFLLDAAYAAAHATATAAAIPDRRAARAAGHAAARAQHGGGRLPNGSLRPIMAAADRGYDDAAPASPAPVEDRIGAARAALVGATIVAVTYTDPTVTADMGWYQRGVLLHLSDGAVIVVQSDAEGNGPGAIRVVPRSMRDEEHLLGAL